ncbi:DUF4247 domain-containing protein [Corynebacterium pacaense]|uniref:DUF4247 domain-containing protein n=1 Tax=Corynebacterium pacaense TaxID=1816684 RepID=UPI0009B9D2AE|nr:DUF4247 domain-containing protein [Corynebacterium pacaense]
MSAATARTIGILLLVASILCVFAALLTRNSTESDISGRWPGGSCANETNVVETISAMHTPQETRTDPATGDTYMKYPKNLVIVSGEGTPECRVGVEDLSRVNSGAFIWLGGGFAPSSPSGSSGGSSGSGGGVK